MESIIYSVKIAWKWSPVEAGKSEQDNINGEREYVDEMPIQPSHWNPDCPCPTCTQIPPEKNELFEIPPRVIIHHQEIIEVLPILMLHIHTNIGKINSSSLISWGYIGFNPELKHGTKIKEHVP